MCVMRTEHACRPTRRYTGGGRPEHAHQAWGRQGPQLSLAFVLSHTHAPIPMSLHIVFFNASCVTEVNACHPNAVDRHTRVFQWQHWCRDTCRFGCTACILPELHHSRFLSFSFPVTEYVLVPYLPSRIQLPLLFAAPSSLHYLTHLVFWVAITQVEGTRDRNPALQRQGAVPAVRQHRTTCMHCAYLCVLIYFPLVVSEFVNLLYLSLLYRYHPRPLSLYMDDTAPHVIYRARECVGRVATYHSDICALGPAVGGFPKARTAAACIDCMICSRIALGG